MYAEILSLWRHRTQAFVFLFVPFLICFFLAGVYRDQVILHVPTVILDMNNSSQSREVAEGVRSSEVFEVVGYARSYDEVNQMLESEKARVAIVIPENFDEALGRGGPATIQTITDGSNMVFSNVTSAASAELVNHLSARLRVSLMQSRGILSEKAGRILQAVQFPVVARYNPAYNYAYFLLFGLSINVLQQTYLLGVATVISREKDRRTWSQFQLVPARRWQVITGKILPYVLVGLAQLGLIFLLGARLFGLPLHGSLPLLLAASVVFLAAVSAFGLLVSAVTRTINSIRFTMVMAMPSFVLSGYTWPMEAMHPVARAIGQCLPLTWYLKAFQAITMKGAGWGTVWPCFLFMGLIALVCLSLSLFWITKRQHPLNGMRLRLYRAIVGE